MNKCIYCRKEEDFKGVEHVIPQSFGTFGSKTPTLNSVCDECNAFFSKELDQTLARDTLEGVTRYKKGIYSGETRHQKGMTFSLADEEEIGEFAGALIVGPDGKTGRVGAPVPQFHILNVKTGKYDKFLKEDIKDLELPDDLYGGTNPGERKMKIIAPSQEEYEAVVDEILKAKIPYRENERLGPPPFLTKLKDGDIATISVNVDGTIDDLRKRAFVKVLFNFAAYVLGSTEVLKPAWDKTRKFVRYKEETIMGRVTSEPFWNGQEREDLRFESNSYNVRIENKNANVIGVIQFYNLFTYEFILTENYSISPEEEVAYRFTPGEEPVKGVKMTKQNATTFYRHL